MGYKDRHLTKVSSVVLTDATCFTNGLLQYVLDGHHAGVALHAMVPDAQVRKVQRRLYTHTAKPLPSSSLSLAASRHAVARRVVSGVLPAGAVTHTGVAAQARLRSYTFTLSIAWARWNIYRCTERSLDTCQPKP